MKIHYAPQEEVVMIEPKGLFITIDGPNGVGKSSVANQLREILTKLNKKVCLTKEPTSSLLGHFVREAENEYHGKTFAYLVAADRAYHIETEIQPAMSRGEIVISDRYVCSSLVLQRLDGLEIDYIWDLNKNFLVPDLTVILTAEEKELQKRLLTRNRLSRFEKTKSRADEIDFFKNATMFLREHKYKILTLENNDADFPTVVQNIIHALRNLFSLPVGD